MTTRTFLAAFLLASFTLALPTAPAAGCIERDVDGPNGLRVAEADVPRPPGPVCPLLVVVYVCTAHADVDPNALTASVTFDACQPHTVIPLA